MDIIDLEELKRGREVNRKFRMFLVPAAIVVVILILANIVKNFYLEIIQLDEIGGLSSVFWVNIGWKAASFIAGWAVSAFALFITGFFARRGIHAFRRSQDLEPSKVPVVLPAIALGFIGGLLVSQDFYIKALAFLNSTAFGNVDPIFGQDIGYYVFIRPFYISIYSFFSGLSVLVFFYAIAYYLIVLIGRDQFAINELIHNQKLIAHNVINIALFIAVRIFSYRFTREGLLYSTVVNTVGASYTDVNVLLPYYRIAPFLLVAVLAAGIFFFLRRNIKLTLASFAVYPLAFIITMLIVTAVQFFIVSPNEYSLEKPYIENNMKYTREAFELDKARQYVFPEKKLVTPEVVERNRDVVDNIRIIDIPSTIRNNIQLQSNTNFYSFYDGDILNYEINGKETPVFISAREVDQNRIPDKSYINTTFRYTHGYGIVMNSINELTSQGQVEYILSGLMLRTTDPSLVIKQPRIYYGELTNGRVIVGAGGIDEIDYDGNVNYRYTGSGGIQMSLFHRILFALQNSDINLITSNYVRDATMLLNRNVVARAQMAFPFLRIDPDAYIVLTSDGNLMWVLNAYTYTDQYPYSQRISGVNYIRNSVKVVIDAYNGSTSYYVIDPEDPIIQTYAKIYPGLFKFEPLPESLQRHNRFPEILFNMRSDILRRYHLDIRDSSAFYSMQDLWAVARKQGQRSEETETIEPYYNLLNLPGDIGEKEELILMLPYTPSGENKNNMVSWLAVRNSYEDYGEMVIFEFPKNINIFGPYQVEVKINQIDAISERMTLWGQGGSDVYKGNLLVIPIEDTVLYVEPIYIRAAGAASIPEVRLIVTGYQDGDEFIYGIGANLDTALVNLLTGERQVTVEVIDENGDTKQVQAEVTSPATDEERAAAIAELNAKYDEIKRALDSMGDLLDKLQ